MLEEETLVGERRAVIPAITGTGPALASLPSLAQVMPLHSEALRYDYPYYCCSLWLLYHCHFPRLQPALERCAA